MWAKLKARAQKNKISLKITPVGNVIFPNGVYKKVLSASETLTAQINAKKKQEARAKTKAKAKASGHYVFVDSVTDDTGKTYTAKSQGKKFFRVWVKGKK